MPDDDRTLVRRVLDGDGAAFETLVNKYQNKVYRLAWSITRHDADAEEVLQDVFLTVHRKLDTFQGNSAFSSWLYRVTANAAMMKIRGRKKATHVALDDAAPAIENDDGAQQLAWAERPEEALQTKEALARVRDALDQLGPDYRSVLVLRDVEGYSSAEVAEMLGMTVPAVKSRLHRARLFVRDVLGDYYASVYQEGGDDSG